METFYLLSRKIFRLNAIMYAKLNTGVVIVETVSLGRNLISVFYSFQSNFDILTHSVREYFEKLALQKKQITQL